MRALMIGIALLSMVPTVSLASDWQMVDWTDTAKFYVDAASITRSGDLVRAWTKSNYSKRQTHSSGKKFFSSRNRVALRCEAKQMMMTSWAYLSESDLQGEVVESGQVPSPVWEDVAPDTVAEMILIFVCANAPPK